ncbi:TPA: DUF1542 domain-containing protein, partial [Streptococcus suis]|nr:DUF1542 domain-containing protein [Streptococcus suis]
MNRSKKKSFDWYGARQRFSIRKYHIGAASVLLGMTLVLGTGTIVSAETGVNGDGDSNGQIVPGNNDGISDGTQPQGDNQGDNSSGVQTGNTTNSTANDQSANDTGSASSQPVGTSRSADTGTQGDGSTNQPVDKPIMIIPSSASEQAPKGYVTVTFAAANKYAKGFTLGTQTGKSVKVFVKENVKWGELLNDPAWQWPTVETNPEDTVVGWAVNISSKAEPYKNKAFALDKYKDTVVKNTNLYPNVVYKVEDVTNNKEQFLEQYGPDEQNKWIFITFDAGKGQLSGSKTSKMVAVSKNLYSIDFSYEKFKEKVESPTLQGHTFVRWQTRDGVVLPKSGPITTETTYEALYLAHPQNQVAVFDSKKLTDSEKEQVKQKIYDANPDLSTGVPQVIKAIDISDTGEATVTFDDKVVTVPSTTLTNEDKDTAKSNAKAEIEKGATEKSDAINASNLTEEEKRARLTEVRDVQDRADIAIDNAATTEDLTKAISDGTAAIEAVSTTSTIKTKAKEALEEAYNTKKDEIDNSSLTAEEKSAKQEELDQAKSAADSAIDTATDDAGVGTALNKGKADIEAIGTIISDKKIAARQQLEDAYSAKETEITNSNLTLEEKATKLAELDKAKEVAENAIDTATDNAGVDTALTNGQSAISGIDTSTSAKKAQAKQDLETAYNVKKDEIAKSALTAEEKAAKQAELDKAKEDADKAIDVATDASGVAKALEAGKTAIAGIDTSTSAKKAQAKQDLETAYNAKKDEIAKSALTAEEKAAKQAELDQAKSTADSAIDAATDNAGVDTALTNGQSAISGVDTSTSAKKEQAKEDLETAYNAKKDEIAKSVLTAEEKAVKQAELDQAKSVADSAIDAATDNAGVDTALTNGQSAISGIDTSTSAKKAQAKEDLEAAYNAKKAEIENSALTDEEKAAKQAELDQAKSTADSAIDAATDNAGVAKALEDGKTAITGIDTSTSAKKAQAKQDLETAYNAKKEEIAKSALTAEEKAVKQAELDKAKEDAENAIVTATDNAGVDTALTNGQSAISGIDTSTSAKKAQAKEELKAAADDAKKAIEANDNLTDAEKQAAKKAVDDEVAKANDAIDAATKADEVDAAALAGEKAVAKEELAAAKQDAKNKIAEDVKAAKEAIDNNPNLSEDEKKGFKDAVDAEAAKAVADIEKATTPEAAQAAEEAGTVAIAEDVLDAAKQDAKNKIAKDLATVEAAIDANSNLSQDEKDAAKLAAQAKAAEAVANIEKAATPEAVQTLEDAAVKDLANIEIKAAYDDAVKAIEAADNLSTAAKTQALEDLKKARQAAEEAIKTATTADEVAKGALDGLKSLAKVEATAAADDAKAAIAQNSNLTDAEKKVYTDAIDNALKDTETKIDAATDADTVDAETVLAQKDIAKQEVAAATADAVKGIEANTNLTDAEKDEYKATVTKAAETAEQAITDATTAADIQSKTFDATQDVAKEEVKADAADAIAGIKANDNLSDTAKKEAIAAIEEARNTTLENIENAKTAAAVDTATLDAEKANAKAEIKAAADDAKKAIDENANLPESDKNALKLAIDAEVAATNLEIDNAKTAEEIDAATLATEKSIAKAEVKAAAEDALQAIDENANLTDDEKAKAKADVYVELSKAEKAIDKATTADAIDNATLVGEKAFAKEELEAAADDAKKAIDENANLTDAEKAAAKAAVDAEVAKANEAIDAATKADEVDTATLAGEKAVAKEELKAAVEDAKKAIDANPNLSDAEKQAAKDAVDASAAAANKAIDGSTSSVEVQAAKDKGNAAIAENVLDAAKQGAKNKLMEEADKAKAAIDANPNLTPEEKAAAKAEIDKAVEEAIIAINGAGTHHALGEIKLPLSALIKPVVTVTPVLDPNNLTEEEIARIKALLEENNTFPEGTEIIVSKDASVSIKYPDGTIDLVLPAEIVKQADTTAPAITDDAKGNIVVAPTKEAVEFVVTYVDNNGKAQLVIVTKGADGKWTTTDKVVIVDP